MAAPPKAILLAATLMAVVLSGCTGSPPGPDGDSSGDSGQGGSSGGSGTGSGPVGPRVVVAVIDTGINPYHDAFQREAGIPEALLTTFVNTIDDESPQSVELFQVGNYTTRRDADKEVWESLASQRLYHFEGTNVLGISFVDSNSSYHILDEPSSHGTGTSSAVLAANPNAIVVMVEGTGNADGEAWAALQPWIDVISMSYGPAVGAPPGDAGSTFGFTTHEATRLAWDNGKIPVGAADNTPQAAPNDETAGPPWVIGVGGDHERTRCRDHISGSLPDVTSNFTQYLARADAISEKRNMSGTSFATPKTAGTLSAMIYQTRVAWGHLGGIASGDLARSADGAAIDNWDVREAMNRTAYYFDFGECQSEPGTQQPVNPAAPWTQMGWGHVGASIIAPSVAHLTGVKEAPEKPEQARAFQESMYEYRRAYWE